MSQTKRTLTEISIFSVTSADTQRLREMKGHVAVSNPLRVHRSAKGFIISLGMFYNGENDAPERLKALGFSDDLIGTLSKAAETGAAYLDVNNSAPRDLTTKSYFDLSTGHLRVKDGELLEDMGRRELSSLPLIIHSTNHGWIIDLGAPRNDQAIKDLGFSDEFVALLAHAQSAGSTMVEFDTDADFEPGFPIFDQVTDEDITADYEDHLTI
jgi:hypothetical protein